MSPNQLRKVLALAAVATLLLASLALAFTKARSVFSKRTAAVTITRSDQMPRVVLWAWERPVDLRFINPRETGVAFLARTVQLRADEVVVRPRLQPLDLPEGTRVIAVVRVETDARRKPDLSKVQTEKLAAAIAEMARLPNVSNIQIDFDATRSERAFYQAVI